MNQFKFVLVIFLLLCAGLAFANTSTGTTTITGGDRPSVAVGFRDGTTGTRTIVRLQDPAYPNSTPTTYARFLVQLYKSTDAVINPLGLDKLPTGDDIASVTSGNATGSLMLSFGPTGTWAPSNFVFQGQGSTDGNTFQGDFVYVRIFNASTIAASTAYLQFNGLYTVPVANATPSILAAPINGWNTTIGTGGWQTYSVSSAPNPAVLVLPANTATNLAYASQTLTWTAGTGAAPTGYKLYFGTDNPPTNIINGTSQTTTNHATGLLLKNQLYNWKVVPFNTVGDATDCPIWSFTTRGEINPNPAINPVPANGAIVHVLSFPYNQTISWSPPATGQAPTGYKLFWNLANNPEDLGNVLTTTKSISAASLYSWQVVPYYTDLGTRTQKLGKPVAVKFANRNAVNVRGDAADCPVWTFTAAQAITHTVDISSTPTDADIFVGGVDSGFNTPHQFVMIEGTSATYTVQKAGYTWAPADLVVNNIQANTSQVFTGTIATYNANVTSVPTGATIYVDGVVSAYTTPHTFVMNYGTSATYSVQMAGYTWTQPYAVTNIQADVTMEFLGTIITYTVDITSTPNDADIYVGGVDSGFNTPHQFVMNYGTSATYTVQKAGYSWLPASFVVNNIQANASQAFTGTILNYTVDITSTPTDADIFVGGVDSGFNTPHQFVLNYGTSATYTVQKTNYSWAPASFVVTNIQANASQEFIGTMSVTYFVDITSTPTDADIYVGGVDTGFNTPHQFGLIQGSGAIYTVQKAGYTWAPVNYVVTNIQANASQNFVGTLLTYTVNITSTPTDADIYLDGVDTGFNSPHVFTMNYGSSATYTVSKAGYLWAPASYIVTNITANANQAFVGTILTYTVDLTSTPTDADIFVNGVDSGFNTPHQFVLNYGSNATYTVQKAGYSWAPSNFVVTNIQANTAQAFSGTMLTYTVDISSTPVDADIYVNGIDSGFNTPHLFVLNYGSNATYTVQKTGYSFTPASYIVTNIQANAVQVFTGAILTYTVDISSTPIDADIFINGVDSGFNTPHQFVLNYGTGAIYTVSKAGYTWAPTSFVVSNITANTSQVFTGTIITFTVDITSVPTDADIYVNGLDTGFNSPHQFVMNYGTSATYTVQKAGYSWAPANLVVNNILANTSQTFTGTLLTYTIDLTSAPLDADIFVNGIDSGFNTPHQFVLTYGSSATYSVSKAGYSWAPASLVINNITANASQLFTGSILTYTVNITSTPADADIFVGGIDTGFNTPHQFVMNWHTNATYSVQKAGYTWLPANFDVTNISANTSQNFVGTIITYTVNITSAPTNADIFVGGVDTGFNTPYQFVMNYGTSAVYSVQKTGYAWTPSSFTINNITANTSQNFAGSLLTYTVNITSTPSDADIFVGGIDTGVNTPYQFVLSYGASATYTVKKAGYSWLPANFVVTNITANTNQNFTGTILTYTVDITSEPINADIFVGGVDTGFNTPHVFTLNYGSNATYTVQKAGYTWTPANFVVNNIQANTGQTFNGTLLSYNVIITSSPSDADILIGGVDTGYNTPYQFTMNYGTSATYTVQKTGYSWSPANYVVNNIQANASQNFAGTLLTYSVNITTSPSDADIFVDGVDSGFNSPHIFTLNYGSNAVYTVQKAGYSWAPASLNITNITANISQLFNGTVLTYTVALTSSPSDADIFVGGVDTGFNTPHTFVLNYGTNATYTLQKPGYIWAPNSLIVSNINANVYQLFNGIPIILTITPANRNVTHQAGATTFSVSSNISWTVTESEAWLSVLPISGSNSHALSVTYDANTSAAVRTGQITITGGNIIRTVTVTQAAAPIALTVSPLVQNVDYSAGTTSFTVTSNSTWMVTESASWFSVSPGIGINNGTMIVTFDANTTTASRNGQIVITAGSQTQTVMVTQAAAPAVLNVTPSIISVEYQAGTTNFIITSNVAWTISETVSWLTVLPHNGNNAGNIVISYTANTTATSRSGLITVTGGGMTQTVEINQSSAPVSLIVTPMHQIVSNMAGSTAFTVSSNATWTVSETEDWLMLDPNPSKNSIGTFVVYYQANPAPISRTGHVTITSGETTQTVTITQTAGVGTEDPTATPAPMLSVYPNPFVSSTHIKVGVTDHSNVSLAVYSTKGQLVKTLGTFSKGSYIVSWDGKDEAGKSCTSGFYFVRYSSAEMTKTVKVSLIKN